MPRLYLTQGDVMRAARDAWLGETYEAREHARLQDEFINNLIEEKQHAFIAGWHACEKYYREIAAKEEEAK